MSSYPFAGYLPAEAGVALLAGSDFGKGREGHLRISSATGWVKIGAAIERRAATLSHLT